MNYTEMLLKKNKNIILILTIYLLLYIILIKYTIVVDKENLYYRTTNYMDGRNGLYRYNYTTQQDTAYLPYQLSGTITLGWWSFLGGEMSELYKNIYETFPLDENALKTYVGPNTTRERNKYVAWPAYFENGFAELNCLLASKLKIEELFY